MTSRMRDERGAALIVAVLVTFVVMLLSTVVISQAIHNTGQAGQDRERLTSVNAAEGGLGHFYNYLETTEIDDLSTAARSESLGAAPGTNEFTVTPTFYADEEGTVPFTGTPTPNNYPGSVKLVSVGTTNDGTERTMESFVILSPIYGGLTGAVVTNSNTVFNNSFTVSGNNGDDGDIYVLNGDFTAPAGIETIRGNIWVTQGSATIRTSLHLYGEVWANGSVTIDHPQAIVDLDAKSSTSSITVTRGTVTGDAYYCTGSPPSNVAGQELQTCGLGAPPTKPFPQIQYHPEAWQTSEYYLLTPFTGANACTNARSYVEGNGAGTFQSGNGVPAGYSGAVVYIDATCTYSASNNQTITLGKDLAILTRGSISLSQRSNWNGAGSMRNLFFMSMWPSAGSPSCPTQNVTVGNLTGFNSLVRTMVYTPCTATMNNNNSAFQGQVIGGNVVIGNLFNMVYKPVQVPGAEIVGFEQDIAYIREVN